MERDVCVMYESLQQLTTSTPDQLDTVENREGLLTLLFFIR